jgi:AraC-like DNA-binding protein
MIAQIYLELVFETLPHFSDAFKKQFGIAPTKLVGQKNKRL